MGGYVAGLGGVDAGDGQRIDAELMGAYVDGLLHRPFGRGIAESPECAGGNLVGVDKVSFDFDVGVLIASVMAHGGDAGNGGRLRRIGAVVGDHVELLGAY